MDKTMVERYGNLMLLPVIEVTERTEQKQVQGKNGPRVIVEQDAYLMRMDASGETLKAAVTLTVPKGRTHYTSGLYTISGGSFETVKNYGRNQLQYDSYALELIPLDILAEGLRSAA